MKRIRLTIDTREPTYAGQLAKGLAITGKHLFMTIADHEELQRETEPFGDDVYLTDDIETAAKIGKKAILLEKGSGKERIDLPAEEGKIQPAASEHYRRLDSMSTLREIYQMIIEVYQIEHDCFIPSIQEKCTLYGFLPATGGCGATAAAVTFGRILAGRDGRRVLYISQEKEEAGEKRQTSVFFEGEKKQLRPPKELEYLLQTGQCFCIDNYTAEDRYGLFYLKIEKGSKPLLQYLEKHRLFSDIILDGTGWDKKAVLNRAFYVLNRQDRRADSLLLSILQKIEREPDQVILLNHCSCFLKKEKNLFWLPKDEESFRCEENQIEISMHMAFAGAIRRVVKEVTQ